MISKTRARTLKVSGMLGALFTGIFLISSGNATEGVGIIAASFASANL